MKRNIFSLIGILSLFVLLSCTTDKKGTGDISLTISKSFSQKLFSISSARTAEDEEDLSADLEVTDTEESEDIAYNPNETIKYYDLVLTVSGDYNETQTQRISKNSEPEDIELTVENIEEGSNITVQLQVIYEGEVYWEGSSSLVVVEGDNPVTIKLNYMGEKADDEPETPTEENKPAVEEPSKEETSEDKPSAEETEKPAQEEEKKEETKPAEDKKEEQLPEESKEPEKEETEEPVVTPETPSTEISCGESYYVVYGPNRTDIRKEVDEKTGEDKSPNVKAFCFDYGTGDYYGVTTSNIYKSTKSSDYALASMKSYSCNLGQYNCQIIKDVCYINGVVYVLFLNNEYKSKLVGFYLDGDLVKDVEISSSNDSDLYSKYIEVNFYGLKTDGTNMYLLVRGSLNEKENYDHMISTYGVTLKVEDVVSDDPNKNKSVTAALYHVAVNTIINYTDSGNMILGNSNYQTSQNAMIADLMVLGDKVFVLLNDRNYEVDDDYPLISRGALITLSKNSSGTMIALGNQFVYGWTGKNCCTNTASEFLGPTKFNKISSSSLSFIDEGFTGSDADLDCRVITIDISMFDQNGAFKFYEKGSKVPAESSKYGCYVDTVSGDEKFTFSDFAIENTVSYY